MSGWVRSFRARRRERGAVAVEAALVMPLLVLLIFGIIEFSFLLRDWVSVSSAVRTGVRIASTDAGAGQADCTGLTDAPACSGTTSPALAQAAADAIQRAGSAMPKDSIDYLLIYKANGAGYPGSANSMPASCAGVPDCVRYTWRASQDRFRYSDGSWTSSTISACFPGTPTAPLDSVGVNMVTTHHFFTGLFYDHMTISDHAVMDFEPLATAMCAAGAHQ